MKTTFVKNSILAFTLILLISSCKNEETTKMLGTIDQLIVTVDSSNVVFKTIDTAAIATAKANAESQLEYIKKFYTDTNYQNARYIDVYNSNFKLMRKLLKGYDRLGSEIDFSKSQLTHLSNDINNGFAADSSYIKYLEGEKKAVSKIRITTKTLVEWEEKSINRYSGMVQPIDSIITELQNQGFR